MMIDFAKEKGRNQPCSCGSGLKYKKCCLKKKEHKESKPDLTLMLKLLYCFVKGLKGQSVTITKRTVIEQVPHDWMEKMKIDLGFIKDPRSPDNNIKAYTVSVEEEDKSKIMTPTKRIILPGEN